MYQLNKYLMMIALQIAMEAQPLKIWVWNIFCIAYNAFPCPIVVRIKTNSIHRRNEVLDGSICYSMLFRFLIHF